VEGRSVLTLGVGVQSRVTWDRSGTRPCLKKKKKKKGKKKSNQGPGMFGFNKKQRRTQVLMCGLVVKCLCAMDEATERYSGGDGRGS